MPFGAVAGAVGTAAAGAAAGSLVSGLVAPGTSGGNSGGSYYVPTGLSIADQQWQALQNGNVNTYNQNPLQPYGQQSLQEGLNANNYYGGGYQAGANNAGTIYNLQAGNAQNNAQTLQQGAYGNYGNAANLMAEGQGALGAFGGVADQTYRTLANAGSQVFNTAMDPQSALYNRSVQQLQDQTGATNSMYGLGSSAAGAGVANQALSNFNIDWQNQQLQRQLTGLQGLAGAYGQGASSYNQGMSAGYGTLGSLYQNAGAQQQLAGQQLSQSQDALGTSAQAYLQGGQVPYSTAQGIAGVPGQLGSGYGSYLQSNVYGPAQGFQQQAIPYMNYGQGAQSVPYQNQMQGAGAAGSLVSQGIQGLGNNSQFQQSVGNLFGNSSSPQGFFGSTQSPGNYSGTGFGGFGMDQSGGGYYGGGGNTYGFTLQ